MAETYHIFDLKALSVSTLATLFFGLRQNSRVKEAISGLPDLDTMLKASMVDALQFIAWTKTADAEHNRNRPKSILAVIQGKEQKNQKVTSFESGEAFEKARAKILRGD